MRKTTLMTFIAVATFIAVPSITAAQSVDVQNIDLPANVADLQPIQEAGLAPAGQEVQADKNTNTDAEILADFVEGIIVDKVIAPIVAQPANDATPAVSAIIDNNTVRAVDAPSETPATVDALEVQDYATLTDQQKVDVIIAKIAQDETHQQNLQLIAAGAWLHAADSDSATNGIWQNVRRVLAKRQAVTSIRELLVAVRVADTQDTISDEDADKFIITLETIIQNL